MTIQNYLETLNLRFKTGISREHTYRGDLQTLLMSLLPDILVTNEPARVACGAPDYMLTRKDIPVGYIEAKDIGVDLGSKTLKEQFDRYRLGLSNLIFTDYLEFHFYRDGVFTTSVSIAKIENGEIIPIPTNFETFEGLIRNFALTISQTIKSPTKLAEMMAGKAKLMADIIEKSLNLDDENGTKSNLKKQMLSFKQMLIHDINNKAFADIYSQTIAYGMFAARYHDPTLPTFSRQEAATLIPKSNPFLRRLFQDIAGYELDARLVWIVEELVNIFLATDVADIMRNFGKRTKQEDPVVHFYETFLIAYNPKLRKERGVWYTPEPVVAFIAKSVDSVLKTEFQLAEGLADISKIKIKTKHVTKATIDKRSKLKEVELEHEVHRVQILDPAVGTGTFLAEVVRLIYRKFEGQQGIWSNYVNKHLIPRLNGFELLMASYAMAHLKMDMLLTETGYKPTIDQRFKIYLTNSLEEAHPDTTTLFSSWLSDEADQANAIKRETPIMVVMGNPPYSGVSSNNGEWITKLIEDYKYIDGEHFKEKKHWLNDDYVKFIRFGEHFIDKTGNGILAFINPHGFLENPTFRGMRWHLLNSFDKIYTLDLHGNSTKKEKDLNGNVDQNVFDIMQGVSINIFIKTGQKKATQLAKVFHYDLYGKRPTKYEFLTQNDISSIKFTQLDPQKPNYFFIPKSTDGKIEFESGFSVESMFPINNSGVVSANDGLNISMTESEHRKKLTDLITMEENAWRTKYKRQKDAESWKYKWAQEDALANNTQPLSKICYRPFDDRWTLYSGKSGGLYARPASQIMNHLLNGENIGLVCVKIGRDQKAHNYFLSNSITDKSLTSSLDNSNIFPLYLYPEQSRQHNLHEVEARIPNISKELIGKIADIVDLKFVSEKNASPDTFSPIDILDYIYAILYRPSYREKFKEFLKIDFPKVPYPENQESFWKLVKLGGELRQIHLLQSPEVNEYITQYPIDGDNFVTKIQFDENYEIINGDTITHIDPVYPMGRVYINDTQYFQMVPEVAWNFYIGGYQPAQKWLKDRKGRELSFGDILHYQKIIVALTKTDELMKKIDLVEF